jgi:23S rRNA pseudouridine1911/1915/1917 synthase
VLAKTREYQSEFNRLLLERKVKKRYRALVTTPPPLGRHVHYMEPTERGPKTVSAEPMPGWLECVLTVVNIQRGDLAGPVDIEINLETGRTHQIRAQLAALGSPIVGDTQYGSNVPYHPSAIGLFSAATSWSDGTRANWSFALAPPWLSNPVTI